MDGYLHNRLTPAELKEFLQQAEEQQESIADIIGQLLASAELAGEADAGLRNKLLDQLLEKIDQSA